MAAASNEIDVALEELEKRLERLSALYEQYFIGIEKLEPSIPRQDVDRRIHALRKTQIRNTAKRFKLQNIIQRYNAFQQYWLRTCREIENGTYHRHVIRAQNRFGDVQMTAAARRIPNDIVSSFRTRGDIVMHDGTAWRMPRGRTIRVSLYQSVLTEGMRSEVT